MKQRLLVLTSSTGSGHDMRAKAFREWVRIVHGDDVEVRIEHVIENGSALGRFGVWLYNSIHRQLPVLHNLYFFIVELFVFTHSQSVSFGGRHFRQLLKAYAPDVILSVHDSTNRGYFEDAKRLCGDGVRCVTYCGEFSGGYGYSRNWVNPRADLFVARTQRALDHAVGLGLNPQATAVFHKLLPPEAFEAPLDDMAKVSALENMALLPDRFTVFLATGGYGANHHLAFLRQILPLADKVQVIAVCGNNRRIYQRLEEWRSRHPELRFHLEGFSERVAEYLQLADVVVTRGGANTTMEALHFSCPLIYDGLGGLMPQEYCTVRYFTENGAARLIRRPATLRPILESWSGPSGEYREVQANLKKLQFDEDPRDLVRMVMGPYPAES